MLQEPGRSEFGFGGEAEVLGTGELANSTGDVLNPLLRLTDEEDANRGRTRVRPVTAVMLGPGTVTHWDIQQVVVTGDLPGDGSKRLRRTIDLDVENDLVMQSL